ncbi:hypothetical protein ACGFMM_13130 [Streptomyces sp. NPDC048604]|uniref:hypothetical protein n=1 Tax=Streptomyces sp. NPDC048604 TaxID=3365578 RepID=UPI00371AFFE2
MGREREGRMAESGDERSRPSHDDAEDRPRPPRDTADRSRPPRDSSDRPRPPRKGDDAPRPPRDAGDRPRPPRPADTPPSPPGDLAGLLALLGGLLDGRAPEDVAILLREELERREFAAYAHGWRDAAAHFAAEEAARTERPSDRTPGQGAVIPFPRGRRPARPDRPPRPAEPEPEAPEPAGRDEPSGGAALPPARPAFAPKSRSSKVPTIPRLDAPRRPRRAPDGETP